MVMVSIPFREFDPLQLKDQVEVQLPLTEFQSPSGNSILFNFAGVLMVLMCGLGFNPLPGIRSSSTYGATILFAAANLQVSIPFREFDPLQRRDRHERWCGRAQVSIPFREFDPLQPSQITTSSGALVGFQSPSGNSILFNPTSVGTTHSLYRVFQSPSGNSILFNQGAYYLTLAKKNEFQSPSGNSILFNRPGEVVRLRQGLGFNPLPEGWTSR